MEIFLFQLMAVILWILSLGAIGVAGIQDGGFTFVIQGWLVTYQVHI